MERKEPIHLFEDVPAQNPDSDDDGHIVEKRHTVEQDATIEGLWARNYIGHEFDLQYQFEIRHDGRTRNLLTHIGKEFVTGDDDTHDPPIREPVSEGDEIIIRATNTTAEYLYHANAWVAIDYEEGLIGKIESVLDILPFVGEEDS